MFEQNKHLYTCPLQCNFIKAIWVCRFLMTIRLNRHKKTSNTNCWISRFLRQLWLYKSLQFIKLDLTLKLLYYSRPCRLYIYVQWKKDRNPGQEIIKPIWLWLNTYLPNAALKHIQYEFLDDNYFHYFAVSFHFVQTVVGTKFGPNTFAYLQGKGLWKKITRWLKILLSHSHFDKVSFVPILYNVSTFEVLIFMLGSNQGYKTKENALRFMNDWYISFFFSFPLASQLFIIWNWPIALSILYHDLNSMQLWSFLVSTLCLL